MRNIRLMLAGAVVSALAFSLLGAAPAAPATSTSAPATTTATAPAPMNAQEMAAKKSLGDFFHAMFQGDQKTAFGFLVYTDAKNQLTAETMFGEILAEQRLRKAVVDAFGADKAKTFDLGMGEEEVKDFEKELGTATVKLNDHGDGANIQMGPGPTFVVISKDGKWQVDFDRTQANMGPMPAGVELTMLSKKIAGYDNLAKEVTAKKYDTVDLVTKQVDLIDRDAEAKGPETLPERRHDQALSEGRASLGAV